MKDTYNEFTAVVEKDGGRFTDCCPEIPVANDQGKTKEECLSDLAEATDLILSDRRENAFRGPSSEVTKEVEAVGGRRTGAMYIRSQWRRK
ncbi:MAG: type II toxin-antitoxin system HicB family antitoxin [Candidatus Latescibacterota bacterium]